MQTDPAAAGACGAIQTVAATPCWHLKTEKVGENSLFGRSEIDPILNSDAKVLMIHPRPMIEYMYACVAM